MQPGQRGLFTILLVDDSTVELKRLTAMLGPAYCVRAVRSGEGALRAVRREPVPDVIVLGAELPDMDGYALLSRLREDPGAAEIPRIFLAGSDQTWDEGLALTLGAADWLPRPLHAAVLLNRIGLQLELLVARRAVVSGEAEIAAEVRRRTCEIDLVQDLFVRATALLADPGYGIDGERARRAQVYLQALAERLSRHSDYAEALTHERIARLVRVAPIRDIGKLGVPRGILLKPGRLEPEEWALIKTHSRLGRDAIAAAGEGIGQPPAVLELAKEVVYSHHERWDGSGYPDGLAEEHIPMSARLMALVDVLDALVSHRAYKAPCSFGAAAEIIRSGRGSQFDPQVVDAFSAGLSDFAAITAHLPDAWPPCAMASGAAADRSV